MSVVSAITPRRGRTTELALLLASWGIVTFAYAQASLAVRGTLPDSLVPVSAGYLALALLLHLMLRWKAEYADPLILPVVLLLNGLGLVMIHRLDIAGGRTVAVDAAGGTAVAADFAVRQYLWTTISVLLAALVLWFFRDHRILRRYTFLSGLAGFVLLLLPLVPFLQNRNLGARIWIKIGSYSFQPGEIAKILLAIFVAGYLVQTRDALSVAGTKVLGLVLPRARDLMPIMVAWALSLGILIFERDLGSSLLFFGLFVAMLYVATERASWVAIGLSLFAGGAYAAYLLFPHVQVRVLLWLDTFSQAALSSSDQLAKGIMGMASGGLLGTGLGRGRPDLTYFPESDFIVPSFGEELGLVGVFAMLVLYGLLVERGLRTAVGTRDGFGKLLAAGLAFSIALQCFVVVGGVTRVIPLTGLTMPFLSAGGSSLVANWIIVAILLRISDHARRPVPDPGTASAIGDAPTQVLTLR